MKRMKNLSKLDKRAEELCEALRKEVGDTPVRESQLYDADAYIKAINKRTPKFGSATVQAVLDADDVVSVKGNVGAVIIVDHGECFEYSDDEVQNIIRHLLPETTHFGVGMSDVCLWAEPGGEICESGVTLVIAANAASDSEAALLCEADNKSIATRRRNENAEIVLNEANFLREALLKCPHLSKRDVVAVFKEAKVQRVQDG